MYRRLRPNPIASWRLVIQQLYIRSYSEKEKRKKDYIFKVN